MRRTLRVFGWEYTRRVDDPRSTSTVHVPLNVGTKPEPHDPSLPSDLVNGKPETARDPVHLNIERLFDRVLGTMGQCCTSILGPYLQSAFSDLELGHDKHTEAEVVYHGEEARVHLPPLPFAVAGGGGLGSVEHCNCAL